MSIRTFNNLMQSKGCVPVMSGFLLLAMIVGGMRSCGGGSNQQQIPGQAPDTVIAVVGTYPITTSMIQGMYDRQMQQMSGATTTADIQGRLYSELLDSQVRAGLYLVEAKKLGISITEEDVIKGEEDQLDQELLMARQQMLQQKILTEKSTQADFDAQIKKQTGMTSAEVKSHQIDQVKAELKTSGGLARYSALQAQTLLPKVLANRIHISDDDLKASFKTMKVKRILFTGATAKDDLAKAQADLKSGQAFEVVANRYSKEPMPKGKKPGDVDTTLTKEALADKDYAPLLKLKEGDVSDPITMPEGMAIYKILSVKDDLPKDFDKNKESYRTTMAQSQAQLQIRNDITELQKSPSIDWKNSGFKALYSLQDLSMNLALSLPERQEKLKAVASDAQKSFQSGADELTKKVAALAWYNTDKELATELTGDAKKALAQDRISAIQAVATFAPGPDLQLELVQIYSDEKDASGLAQALITACEQNSDTGPQGQAMIMQIKTALRMNDALLPEDAKKSIQSALDTWAQTKAQNEADQKQAEAATKAAQAQNDADKKKLEDKQKQAAQQTQKPGDKK